MGSIHILAMNFSTTSRFYRKYPSFLSIYREKGALGFKLSYEKESVFSQMFSPQTNFECRVASSGITTSSIGFHPFSNMSFVLSSAASLFLSRCIHLFQEMSEHTALSIHFFCLNFFSFSPEQLLPSLFPAKRCEFLLLITLALSTTRESSSFPLLLHLLLSPY